MTLAIAVFGVALAACSLGWQVAAWALSAARLRVKLLYGLHTSVGLVTSPVPSTGNLGQDLMNDPQFAGGVPILAVQVTNVGRATAMVSRCGVTSRGHGISLQPLANGMGGPSLPHRLPAGEAETWFIALHQVATLVDTGAEVLKRPSGGAEMWVETATGKTYRTKAAAR